MSILKVYIGIFLVHHFCSISEVKGTQTCQPGWPVRYRGSYFSNGYTMVTSKEFSCYGKVTQWQWYAYYSSRSFRAIVWRPVPGQSSSFQIVGINDIPSLSSGSRSYTVPEDQQIEVKPGDVIGWSYGSTTINYNSGSGISSNLVRYESGSLYSSLRVGQTREINDGTQYLEFSIQALVDEVVDEDPPVVSGCPHDIEARTEFGTNEREVDWIEPTAADDSRFTEVKTHSPGEIFEGGITHVAYIYTDWLGNRAACTFTITVAIVDSIRPSISNCTDNINTSIELGNDGTYISWSEPFATDLSGTPRLIQSHVPSTKFPPGETIVTYTFFDTSNNSATCNFTVTVDTVDTTPPIVTLCPSDFVGLVGRIVTWEEPEAFDLSDNITTTKSHSPELMVTQETKVVYKFTDLSGNADFCRFTIYVEYDTIPPVVIDCPGDIKENSELGIEQESVFWTIPSATDENGRVMLIYASHSPGEKFPAGMTPVIYIFVDDSYNEAYCNFTVMIHEVDTTPPTVHSCPSDINLNIEPGRSAPVSWIAPSATDVSGNVSLVSQSHHPGNTFTVGTNQVIYLFKDGRKNEALCAFYVNLIEVDTLRPKMVYCPFDIITNVEVGFIGTVVNWTEPVASDESGNVTLISKTHTSGQRFVAGITTVTYLFVDPSNNIATCEFKIIGESVDTLPPEVFNCPSDINTSVEIGIDQTPVFWNEPISIDASGRTPGIHATHDSGQVFPIGMTHVSYAISDEENNRAFCNFSVTVTEEDRIPPEIVGCPRDVYKTVELSTASIHVSWEEPTASDKSGIIQLLEATHKPGEAFLIGSTLVSYTFTDSSNNSATCQFRIHISEADTRAPLILFCPNNVTSAIDAGSLGTIVKWTEPIAEDASGHVMLLIQTHSSGTFFAIGTTIVSYIFRDNANNMEKCSFPVTVSGVDKTSWKVVNCPSNIITRLEPGRATATVTWSEPVVINRPANTKISSTHEANELFPIGSTQVVYTFQGSDGNNESCNFTVTVVERENTSTAGEINPQIHFLRYPSERSGVSYAALVISLLIVVLIVCLVVLFLYRWKRRRSDNFHVEGLDLSTTSSLKSVSNF